MEEATALSETRTCIYCPSVVPPTSREHVMSQAWVRSSRTGPSPACVTTAMAYFSKHLELPLGRDSFEGYRRVELGVAPPEKIEKLLHRRVKFTLQEPGIFDGVRMTMKADKAGIVPVCPSPRSVSGARDKNGSSSLSAELNDQVIAGLTGDSVEIKIIGSDSAGNSRG